MANDTGYLPIDKAPNCVYNMLHAAIWRNKNAHNATRANPLDIAVLPMRTLATHL